MATFVVLASVTIRASATSKMTITRAEALASDVARKSGVTVKDMFGRSGRHDVVAICEAADDESSTALC